MFHFVDSERRSLMSYDFNGPYGQELRSMAEVLKLINYRQRTHGSYLYAISLCCEWLDQTYHISIDNASVLQLREHLNYLKKPKNEGGHGFAPRSVNISNCAIKRYFQFVLRRPLDRNDLPTMRVDHPLPKVPSKKEMSFLLKTTKNLKHRTLLAMAYGCALRLTETITLRFGDISFSSGLVTIRAEFSKNRREETVELPSNLKNLLLKYYLECCRGARPDDWLFPGMNPGTHISKHAASKILKDRLSQLGWASRGYTFHSLRHAHALHYYLAGADIYQVQVRLRHRSISSTTIYVSMAGRLQERSRIGNPFDDPGFKM